MWAHLLAAAIGVWLMAAPAVLGFGGTASDAHRILGPLAATFGVVAIAEATRPVRWGNAAVGVALVACAFALDAPRAAAIDLALSGIALAALAAVRGRITERIGGGWAAAWPSRRGGS